MTSPEVFVAADHDLLLEAVTARLVTHLVDRVAAAGRASLLIAGDPLIAEVIAAASRGPASDAVDWPAVSVWWANDSWSADGDHRDAAILPMLAELDIPLVQLHPIPEQRADQLPEDVASEYADQLSAAREADDHGTVPAFDVALLEVSASGSVAGLYPERPTAHAAGAVTVDRAAHQVTLTASALCTAREVWLIGSGPAVAPGVHLALSGAGSFQVPAAGVRGAVRTLVLVDEQAADRLPHALRRIASP